MELDHIHLPPSNYSKLTSTPVKIGFSGDNGIGGPGPGLEDKPDVIIRHNNPGGTMCLTPATEAMNGGGGGRYGRQWQNSSRIIRVSRASGGKDRHSKVWTAKGARDRRVRLSVNTAIQFYDLQDRLGYDQPSKAVEWLIKAAAESINELPSLDSSHFPPEVRSGNNVVNDSAELQINGDNNKNSNLVQDRSGCSSNNSDGSGLSLSRTEIRVKARERARERTAKEKKEIESESRVSVAIHAQNPNPINNNGNSQSSSFTQLLTAGITNLRESGRNNDGDNSNGVQWLPDYSRDGPLPHVMALMPSFSGSTSNSNQIHHHHHQQQQFPFLLEPHHQQHPADFNRGTLQSNSSSSTQTPSFLPYFQRFSTADGGSSVPFFLGGAPISPIVENHYHQFNPAGLELSYGNEGRHSSHKGKGKN